MLHMGIIYQVFNNNKLTRKKHNMHKKKVGIKN